MSQHTNCIRDILPIDLLSTKEIKNWQIVSLWTMMSDVGNRIIILMSHHSNSI